MEQLLPKAKQWIDEKKDPRSACWQAALDAVVALFLPDMEKGQLTQASPLEEDEMSVFKAALETVDLSPGLLALFLPPSIADTILPPDSAEELVRIEKGKPSYKILIKRPGKEERILCAEISEHAHRPGIDIFQSGAFLGNFDYDTHELCIAELTKAIRVHAWEKNEWQRQDYISYTLNWFDKTLYFGKSDVPVDKNRSFFHSPTLIKSNRVDALFMALYETLKRRFKDDSENLDRAIPKAGETAVDKENRMSACVSLVEIALLDLLNVVKALDLIDFADFSDEESKGFQSEFVRTVRKLSSDLDEIITF